MRRILAGSAILFTVLFAILLPASNAAASESFTLHIPQRFNASQETGEVRITLVLNGAPAGAQLVVNGSTTLALGQTQTVAGDSVTFDTGVGNEVRVTYKPLSNFNVDLCDGGAATEKTIPMRFAGAQDVTEYRVTSYVVAAPAVECSKASKRTGDLPAELIPVDDGVAPALTATNRGRHPLDLVLVLDKSGSMSELPPDAVSGATKVAILHSAMAAFLNAWKEIDQPTMDGGEWSQDRIGVVFFDSAATPQTMVGADPPAAFFMPRGVAAPGPTHQWNAVNGVVANLTPGGSTSIGAGINAAMQQWTADPDHDLFILLVTDGKQNTAPLVAPSPANFLALPPVGGLPDELRERFIPIQTIGFGMPAAVDDALLRNISLETSGVSYISVNATTMYDFLAATLVSILKGNTASIATRTHATLTGKGPAAAQPLVVDSSAQRVVFMLQWAPPLANALDLRVTGPGGTVLAPTAGEKTPQSTIQSYDVRPAQVGTWSVQVERQAASPLGAAVPPDVPVPYTLNVLFLERHLDYRLAFDTVTPAAGDAIHPGTGDRVRIRANVAWDGKPLTGLPAGAIRVRIQRPNEALGTILHDTRFADSSTGTTTTPSGDVQSAYDRKLAAASEGLLGRVLANDVATIALTEEGHGIYAGTFDGTSVPGTYGFEAVLDWDDARTGHVHREERLEEHVKVKADPARTLIATSRAADGSVRISVTPRDRFGNYAGPGYTSAVRATLNGPGTISGPVDADQTGTYVFTVTGVPAGDVPNVDVVFDGIPVGNTATPGGAPPSSAHWRGFAALGPNFPYDSFSNAVDGQWSANAGVERLLSPAWSLEAILGYHRFDAAFIDNPHILQLSLGAKRYFGTTPWRPYVNAGIGAYRSDPGHTTDLGANLGAGVLYDLTPNVGLEAAWNFHEINSSPDDAKFSTVQLGVRFTLK